MTLLPDAAKLDPEALARRWFSYILFGVFAIVATVTVLVHSTNGPPASSHTQSQVGEVDPRAR
jgi:hypothetical protein